MSLQPFLIGDGWIEVRDGDDTARALFDRHYSRRADKPRRPNGAHLLIVGPGEKLVLLTPCARALFAWRRFVDRAGEIGVCCAVFRNEGAGLSSDLIRAADAIADRRWPGERHYTHVDPAKVRSANPGFCFLAAGWRRGGRTKVNGLLILERPSAPAEIGK